MYRHQRNLTAEGPQARQHSDAAWHHTHKLLPHIDIRTYEERFETVHGWLLRNDEHEQCPGEPATCVDVNEGYHPANSHDTHSIDFQPICLSGLILCVHVSCYWISRCWVCSPVLIWTHLGSSRHCTYLISLLQLFLFQLLRGLAYCHARRILHR